MRAAEEQEYDWYFRACFPPVSRTVFLMVHDRELAQDVTQEALYRMLRHWRTVSHYERPEAWVRRVAIRIAVRELQRRAAGASKERLAQRRYAFASGHRLALTSMTSTCPGCVTRLTWRQLGRDVAFASVTRDRAGLLARWFYEGRWNYG